MGIVIAVVIVLGVLGSVFRFLILAALIKRKRTKMPPAANVQTEPAMPDTPNISDEELRNKLGSLKKWTWIRRLTVPVIGVGILAALCSLTFYGSLYLDEFVVRILLPAAVIFILGLVLFCVAGKKTTELKNLMGSAVTLPVIREIFEVSGYRPNGYIERETVSSAGLVFGWEDISGSDYFVSSYKGINIRYSDLHLTHEEEDTDSDGNKTTKTVTDFNGQWLICDFGKELSASVRLIERKGGSRWNRRHDISKSDIETENIAFNKKFRIMTGDGHAAFYLFTPHFMERLTAADEMADASTLFYFGDGTVHIALNSGRDSFELKGVNLSSIDNVRQKFRGELKYLADIVDELLLNEKLFKEG